jgi:hypothetical protein
MKTGFPAWLAAILVLAVCFFFSQPVQNILGFLCAISLFLSATTVGRFLRKFLDTPNYTLDFPLGLGTLLLILFTVGCWNASIAVLIGFWCLLFVLAFPSIGELKTNVPWYVLWGIPFFVLSIWSSFTPTTFYDALAYNLGLPYQYLAYERILTFPTSSTSFFPPFDQVTKFLFISLTPQNGIKLFSFLLYVHCLRMVVYVKPEDINPRFIVIPLLILPVPWILLHIVNPDLMNSFFFVAGICALFKLRSVRDTTLASTLLAFVAWTKYTIYPFLIFTPVMFWRLNLNRRQILTNLLVFSSVFILIISPLCIRNWKLKGDPFYPMLAPVLTTGWEQKQIAAVQGEFPTPRTWKEFAKAVVTTPFLITFRLKSYGSASEVGMLPLLALILLPFQLRKLDRRLLLYVLLCYLIYVYTLYHFRYFLPVFVIAMLLLAYSFQLIHKVAPRAMPFLWIAGVLAGMFQAYPVYKFFPLISPIVTTEQYLASELNYYSAAQFLKKAKNQRLTLTLGETRIAYFQNKLIPHAYADHDPLLTWARKARSAEEIYTKLKEKNVGHIIYNPGEMDRLSRKYKIWQPTQEERLKLTKLMRDHFRVVYAYRGIVIFQVQ